MYKWTIQPVLAAALAIWLGVAMAATPVIGTVLARGSFQVDGSAVSGNATLFDGTTVRTGAAASDLKLTSGARIVLAAASQGEVHADHLILDQGQGQLETEGRYRIQARGLWIEPAAGGRAASVALETARRVQVAALNGAWRVTNARGVLLANVAAGSALEFEPQESGAAAATEIHGKIFKKDGHYFLTDEASKVTFELQGSGLESKVGKRVKVAGVIKAGAVAAAGAAQVLTVTSVTMAAAAAGISTGAIVAGVAVASGAGVGIGVAATRGGDERPAASR